ncbi:MAG TPA: hypothetical protein H9891_08820 [Candidatus Salinicoccus stercoripullorum]|uniref:Uncharacterized protein n=1 Tax=Candidatus Salinicoccus stercoripullorum TaxID=2838756 RepID=A0A9D1QI67_9STAP|nr:hypothetical protein [Candidatus Salinicoccus stercoripullorum]
MKKRSIFALVMCQVLVLSACGMNSDDESEFDQQQTINDTNYQESDSGSDNGD